MCSNSCDCDDIEDTILASTTQNNDANDDCKTCGAKANVILRKRDAYCETCFLAGCTHKFRATLGKSKLVKPGYKILVAFSGGPSSTAMVRLLLDGLSEDAHKRLLFEPSLLFIDDSVIRTPTSDANVTDEVVALMSEFGLPFYVCPLELVYASSIVRLDREAHKAIAVGTSPDTNSDLREIFMAAYSSFKTPTDRESFYKLTFRRLLLRLAAGNGFVMVFTAETGTVLAANLLSTVALGRGSQLRAESGFLDDRDGRVKLLRPMREFTSEEVALFNERRGIAIQQKSRNTSTSAHVRGSVAQLTESFVNGLQRDFPATVSTIWRTGDKITSLSGMGLGACALCSSPLDTANVPVSSAVEALRLTRDVSRLRVGESSLPATSNFCYACQALVEAGDSNLMQLLADRNNLHIPENVVSRTKTDTGANVG